MTLSPWSTRGACIKMIKCGYLAPALVVAFIVLYYGGMAALFVWVPGIPGWAKALMCIVPLVVCAMAVYVLVQRIREIKSGEEDDLDKY